MLIPAGTHGKWPFILVWIDWNLYAHWGSLLFFLAVFVLHYAYCQSTKYLAGPQPLTPSGFALALFVGFCAWLVCCAFRQGYAVG